MESTRRRLILEETIYTVEQLEGRKTESKPQIALAGRSNVGKSSLINALGECRQLAKVSATPGKTASINYFLAEPGGFYLVDLPGYGYARRSKAERSGWSALIRAYLKNSPYLKALAVLMDCRLEPQEADLGMLAYTRSLNLPVLAILTKADKCGQQERLRRVDQWSKLLAGQRPILTSSVGAVSARIGLTEVWEAMQTLTL